MGALNYCEDSDGGFCEHVQSGRNCPSWILTLVFRFILRACKTSCTLRKRVFVGQGGSRVFSCVTCRYPAVLQVLSTLPQATCQGAMRPTSPLLVGPSPSGGSSTPGSASWSYTPPPTCSEGSAHRQQPSAAYCELRV